MKVLCVSGSRADYGSIIAVYEALKKQKVDVIYMKLPMTGDFEGVDLAVIEGDRFEILKVAVELYLAKIPIVHLGGGDITEGSQDDCLRHAITKLSHLHFPTNADSAKRIIQMGEEAWRVKTVGEPAIDHLETLGKGKATEIVGEEDYILVVWHPNTLASEGQALAETAILTHALDEATELKKLVVGPNNDAGSRQVSNHLKNWCQRTDNKYVESLPRDEYLTVLKYAKCLVGNSSSGYHEAPSFGTEVIDIGERQRGRIKPDNVLHTPISHSLIINAIQTVLGIPRPRQITNPYGMGNSADQVAIEIAKLGRPGHDPKKLLTKRFYSIKH